jgi:glycosyltransferase involved in cell wall biosynthesis
MRLKASGLRFRFDVFGPGEQATQMRHQIENENLSDMMTIHDPLDFDTELVPWLRMNADIFVCCHRQSDPSCTYMETLGCGVPIAGYMNNAFAGVLELGDIGWGVGMDDIDALAKCIRNADNDREAIANKSANAVKLSSSHSFERTFQARIDQLNEIAHPAR